MEGWVSFTDIKARTRLAQVLRWCGVEGLRRSGGAQYRGRCPIHGGEGADAFHANLERDVFHCFACGAGGNVLDFVMALRGGGIREAAVWIERQHCGGEEPGPALPPRRREEMRKKLVTKESEVNAALSFRLAVDSRHAYLAGRGIQAETAAHFGIGWFGGSGLMHNRVAIPIHDAQGRLIAYCGRSVDGELPRYRFPAGFRKSQVLYNYPRALARAAEQVIVVEGFFDCLRVHQAGYGCVVALMGAALSAAQKTLLTRYRRVWLMLDGDPTGRAATLRLTAELASDVAVRPIFLAAGAQPDQLEAAELREVLGRSEQRTGASALM